MNRPTYKIQGKDIELAIPTPKRISQFLTIYGKKKLSDLFLPGNESIDSAAKEFGTISLDVTGNSDTASKILCICLAEDVSSDVAADLPVDLIAQVNMDFFLQLILTYYRQVK